MIHMANLTTRRTDKEVLSIISEFVGKDEVVSLATIAQQLDCHELTVIRAVSRLETLKRLQVDRSRKPNRYTITG